MFKWICRKLAECFNAHLSEQEEQYRRDLEACRAAAKEFNRCLKKVSGYKTANTYVRFSDWSHDNRLTCSKYFSLGKIEGEVNNRKEL